MDFSREPRLPPPPVAEGDITLDAPPEVQKALPASPLARLLPVAVLVAAGGMMALYFTSGAATTARGPMFMFFPVMMLASVLGSLAYGTRGANQTAQLNEDRRAYLGYLVRWIRPLPPPGSTSIARCTGSIPTRTRCGHCRVARGCGNAESTIPTSVMSVSAAVISRSAPRS